MDTNQNTCQKLKIDVYLSINIIFSLVNLEQGRTDTLKAAGGGVGAPMSYSLNLHDYLNKISKAGGVPPHAPHHRDAPDLE